MRKYVPLGAALMLGLVVGRTPTLDKKNTSIVERSLKTPLNAAPPIPLKSFDRPDSYTSHQTFDRNPPRLNQKRIYCRNRI